MSLVPAPEAGAPPGPAPSDALGQPARTVVAAALATEVTADADLEADPIPPELRGVLALFRDQLDGVAFPDVDAAALARLSDHAARRAHEVAMAQLALRAAEEAAALALAALRAAADRGLAYARIYAGGEPRRDALLASIDALATPPRAPSAEPPKRRGRPPKAASASLFGGGATAGAMLEDAAAAHVDGAAAQA